MIQDQVVADTARANGRKPIAVFNAQHPWMQQMIRQAAPPEFEVRFIQNPRDAAELAEKLPTADFLVTVALPCEWVKWLTRCKLVQLQGVGCDAVDLAALAEADIPLAATPEGTIIGVAEHTILLILALCKRLVEVHQSVVRGEFDTIGWRDKCHFFAGQTLGIVGLGRIGRRVAQLANAFGVHAIYFDVQRPPPGIEAELFAQYRDFDELLAEADIVSVHTPHNDTTTGLFATKQFARMKPGALFINTSRGRTYDLDALYESLRAGHLGGAGLDVFHPQPPPKNHPLLSLPNVICTPHMATGTVEAHQEKARAQFANFARVLRGEPPLNALTDARGTAAASAS
jgi:phosphoglycerate dehydrogenase-like enzyme